MLPMHRRLLARLQVRWLQKKEPHQQRQPLLQKQQLLPKRPPRTMLQPLQGRQQVQL